jgi:signal transduction histidine kinase
MTLDEWFKKKAGMPLIVVGLLVGLIWIMLSFGVIHENEVRQNDGVRQLANLLSLSIDQKNRILTESLLESSHISLGAESAVICVGEKAQISSNADNSACTSLSGSVFHPVLKYRIPGHDDTLLVVAFTGIHENTIIWFLLLMGLLFSVLSFIALYRIRVSLLQDILGPLQHGILTDKPMLISEFEELRKRRKLLEEAKVREAAVAAVLENKSKVAHNIKSPLRTLRLVQDKISDLIPTKEAKLLGGVVESINKILSDQRAVSAVPTGAPEKERRSSKRGRELVFISDFIEETVAQKAAEYSGTNRLSISAVGHENVFVDVVKHELGAVFSNLINNSVEAIGDRAGKVRVEVRRESDVLIIRIVDTGSGIPTHIQENIFANEFTFGKKTGSGFGLYHARQYLEHWSGSISHLVNEPETTFELRLPIAQAPSWFVDSIQIAHKKHVVILDDDSLIHSVWTERFASLGHCDLTLHHATSEPEFDQCINKIGADIADCIILCDFDLGSERTGLDVISSYGLVSVATMVTNSFNDQSFLSACTNLGLKILPKPLIHIVSISS